MTKPEKCKAAIEGRNPPEYIVNDLDRLREWKIGRLEDSIYDFLPAKSVVKEWGAWSI
jgi:hypothetical protein